MDERCPFCWDESLTQVSRSANKDPCRNAGRLMQCDRCEKWFWADSGEEVPRLFTACQVIRRHPEKCYPEIREVIHSKGSGFPRNRQGEFNFLCSRCPHGKFMPLNDLRQSPAASVIDSQPPRR